MKCFVVSLCIGDCLFDHKCDSIKDAYYSVTEASVALEASINLDEVMTALVHMNEGQARSCKHGNIRVTVRDREV